MENLSTYKHYATVISTSIVKKPIIVIPAIGIIELSNSQMALALFFVLLFFDFFTGVLASYTEWKKLGKKTKFFTDGKVATKRLNDRCNRSNKDQQIHR